MRTVEEWIGKSDDAKVPPHVRLRIFEREKGKCHISGRRITPADQWDLDHKVALADGGEHREANLFPAIRERHREKTAAENTERAVIRSKRSKHFGIRAKSTFPKRIDPWNKRRSA